MAKAQRPAPHSSTGPPMRSPQHESKTQPSTVALPADLYENRLVGSAAAAATLNYSLAHFRRLDQAGKIPPSVQINGRKKGWRVKVLLNLVEAGR